MIDVSNPISPTKISSTATFNNPLCIAVAGNYAYLCGSSMLQALDISNPLSPAARGSAITGSTPRSIAVSGNYAYVVNRNSNSLQVFMLNTLVVNGSLQIVGGGSFGGMLTALGGIQFGDGTIQTTAGLVSGSAAGGDLTGSYPNPTIANGVVTAAKIASGVIPTTLPPSGTAGGDLTGTYPNPTITANAVTNGKLASDAASLTKVSGGAMSVSGGNTTVNGSLSTAQQLHVDNGGGANNGIVVEMHGSNFQIKPFASGSNRAVFTNSGGGDIYCQNTLTVNGFNNLSDARFKTNVASLHNALDDILSLRGVAYDWKRDAFKDRNFAEGRQFGFIAQEVEKIFPDLVATDEQGYKAVNYLGVIPVLVEAVKTQNKRIEALSKENNAKEKRLSTVEAQNAELKKRQAATETKNAELEARLERIEAALKVQK